LAKLSSVEIIGSGLIGTSIGLALAQKGVLVSMRDQDARSEAIARDLVGHADIADPEVIISAVPVSAFKSVLQGLDDRNFKGVLIDVASIKTKPKVEVSAFSDLAGRFVPTHPMAGREVGGAAEEQEEVHWGPRRTTPSPA
jgi:prephenate dehydrogenase